MPVSVSRQVRMRGPSCHVRSPEASARVVGLSNESPALTLPSHGKPRMRGVLHQYAAVAAVAGGIYLVSHARAGQPAVSAAVYASCLVTMLCVSALYHRPMWSLERRKQLRRVDHATIF